MTSTNPKAVRHTTVPHGPWPQITDDERRLLAMLAAGLTQDGMARRAGRSRASVQAALKRIYRRIGATNAPNAVAIAIRDGLITVRPNPNRATPAPNRGAHHQ